MILQCDPLIIQICRSLRVMPNEGSTDAEIADSADSLDRKVT
ncbi:hypothetical protein Hanom_Chr17g01548721 [Helianthus anomalus]